MTQGFRGGFVRDEDTGALVVVGSGQANYGSGDNQNLYPHPTTPEFLDLRKGTAASPDTSLAPLIKVVRTQSITRAALEAATSVGSDGGEQLASLQGIGVALATSEVQPVGVYGSAVTYSEAGVANNDAVGSYAIAAAYGRATGTAIGLTNSARRTTATARITAAEVTVDNSTVTAEAWNPAGYSRATGIHVAAKGTAGSAVGISFANPTRNQFEVAIGFTSQNGGAASVASIRDESLAPAAIWVGGAHSKAAIITATGAGPTILGAADPTLADPRINSAAQLELQAPAGTYDPLVAFHVPGATSAFSIKLSNGVGAGGGKLFIAGSANNFLTGTAQGDIGVQIATSGKTWHVGTTGGSSILRVNNTGLGFQGTAPIAKPTVSGAKGSNAALGSLLTALANYGLVTDSTSA